MYLHATYCKYIQCKRTGQRIRVQTSGYLKLKFLNRYRTVNFDATCLVDRFLFIVIQLHIEWQTIVS